VGRRLGVDDRSVGAGRCGGGVLVAGMSNVLERGTFMLRGRSLHPYHQVAGRRLVNFGE
jgi:hypothetical protein